MVGLDAGTVEADMLRNMQDSRLRCLPAILSDCANLCLVLSAEFDFFVTEIGIELASVAKWLFYGSAETI